MAVEMEQVRETLETAQNAVVQVQEADAWVSEIQQAYDGTSGLTIALCAVGALILLRPLLALIQYVAVFFVIFLVFKHYV